MPANVKYLTRSPAQRFAKFSAGFFGGLLVSIMFHLAAGVWLERQIVAITALYSVFLLWVGLLILAYLFENGWWVWLAYLLAALLFGLVAYAGGATIFEI